MKLSFHGAAQTVTGSMHLLELNGSKVLLDCGLYQGRRKESIEKNRNFQFDPKTIDAVILSHAHIDHSGNLPNLVKQGFSGLIYCTPATEELTDVMVRDSGHVQEKQAESASYHNMKRGEPPVDPLYTEEDAKAVAPLLQPIAYGQEFEPAKGIKAVFHDAGHILGSASVSLKLNEQGNKKHLWFSGDIGRRNMPILRDPVLPDDDVDILIMESTYGDKPHRDPEEAYLEMQGVIRKTLNGGGKVIIPSFAVGRTQELVYNLSRMYDENELPKVPVYVDSPLAVNASDIFRRHPECYDREMKELIQKGHPALEFNHLTYVKTLDESKALNMRDDPMIIISASGMAEAGRVVYHIRWALENKKNTIMIVSWQAPDTLGRRIADREKQIKIFGDTYNRRAEVATIGGLSAHAGQNLLVEYGLRVKKSAEHVFIVHGEEKGALPLMGKFKEYGMHNVHFPAMYSSVEL
ncbi:MAG: MBL fold metallo-hydrolase [Anaerolineales bacterium]|nr:MBL fold metallo-hydrolase [Anaerolineales bacterium]MCB9144194.1 MBL fold metallo-hydrolase [Anaerolineales bacterium]